MVREKLFVCLNGANHKQHFSTESKQWAEKRRNIVYVRAFQRLEHAQEAEPDDFFFWDETSFINHFGLYIYS